jgi:hypothetical protein
MSTFGGPVDDLMDADQPSHTDRLLPRPWSSTMVVLLGGLLLTLHMQACEEGDSPISVVGKAGRPCPACPVDSCNGFEACECDTCAWLGYDPASRELLACSARGVWELRRECPGGVSVECGNNGGYTVQCLSADGGELPLSD